MKKKIILCLLFVAVFLAGAATALELERRAFHIPPTPVIHLRSGYLSPVRRLLCYRKEFEMIDAMVEVYEKRARKPVLRISSMHESLSAAYWAMVRSVSWYTYKGYTVKIRVGAYQSLSQLKKAAEHVNAPDGYPPCGICGGPNNIGEICEACSKAYPSAIDLDSNIPLAAGHGYGY